MPLAWNSSSKNNISPFLGKASKRAIFAKKPLPTDIALGNWFASLIVSSKFLCINEYPLTKEEAFAEWFFLFFILSKALFKIVLFSPRLR
jgi:hypothetical protein